MYYYFGTLYTCINSAPLNTAASLSCASHWHPCPGSGYFGLGLSSPCLAPTSLSIWSYPWWIWISRPASPALSDALALWLAPPRPGSTTGPSGIPCSLPLSSDPHLPSSGKPRIPGYSHLPGMPSLSLYATCVCCCPTSSTVRRIFTTNFMLFLISSFYSKSSMPKNWLNTTALSSACNLDRC